MSPYWRYCCSSGTAAGGRRRHRCSPWKRRTSQADRRCLWRRRPLTRRRCCGCGPRFVLPVVLGGGGGYRALVVRGRFTFLVRSKRHRSRGGGSRERVSIAVLRWASLTTRGWRRDCGMSRTGFFAATGTVTQVYHAIRTLSGGPAPRGRVPMA